MKKPFIVAEMSANHNGSMARALAIVNAARHAGADAVKLQTWKPGTMCVDKGYMISSGPWAGRALADLYQEAYLPWKSQMMIFEYAARLGIECFSAPFDSESVDFLETLGCPRYKIASFELVDLDLIRYVASKGKPMILSTGMASFAEVVAATQAAEDYGCTDITLLRCTSAYPADASDANLDTMRSLNIETGWPAGLSDHTPGIGVAVAAVALGATMIEKHLTLSRADGGLDAGFSMEPDEFAQMVTECRRAAAAIGTVKYGCGPNESTALRRSLYFRLAMQAGETITADHLCTARPALGLECDKRSLIVGKRVTRDIAAGTPVTFESFGS